MKTSLKIAMAALALSTLTACKDGQGLFGPSAAEIAAEQARIAEARRVELADKARKAIEAVLGKDQAANVADNPAQTVTNMRAIDLAGTPADFRDAYLRHVRAWETMAGAREALVSTVAVNQQLLTTNSVCSGYDCPAGDTVAAAQEVRLGVARMREADQQISATFDELAQVARAHGARVPAAPANNQPPARTTI